MYLRSGLADGGTVAELAAAGTPSSVSGAFSRTFGWTLLIAAFALVPVLLPARAPEPDGSDAEPAAPSAEPAAASQPADRSG